MYQERGGILNGGLSDVSTESVDAAQAELLRGVEAMTDLKYSATWISDDPGWWSADIERQS